MKAFYQKSEVRSKKNLASCFLPSASGILFFASCFYSVFFLPSLAFSLDSNVMHTEALGTIAITENTADADRLALEDAFKRAVAKGVESIVPKGELDKWALILDDTIYNNAARYILNYRILSKEIMEDESPVTEGGIAIYNAYIEADIAVELLTKDITSAGIIQEGEVKRISITLLNFRNYKAFEFLKSNIFKARGVKKLHYISFARDKIELAVEASVGAYALQQEITDVGIKEGKIEAAVVAGWLASDKIEIRFFPIKRQVNQ